MLRRIVGVIGAASLITMSGPLSLRAAQVATRPPDLTGEWRLDPLRSDAPPRPPDGGRGMWSSGHGGGSGGGHGGWSHGGSGSGHGGPVGGGPGAGGSSGRPLRLPDLMHVTQTDEMVSFEDSTGAVLREITTLGGTADTLAHAPGALVVAGGWKDGVLQVERRTSRGPVIRESIRLDDQGAMVVATSIEGVDIPKREFKRVYRRTES